MIFEVVKIVVKISKLIKNCETLTAETLALQRFAGFEKFYPNALHPAPKPRALPTALYPDSVNLKLTFSILPDFPGKSSPKARQLLTNSAAHAKLFPVKSKYSMLAFPHQNRPGGLFCARKEPIHL